MVSPKTLLGNINKIPQFADMLQYLIIQLCDTSTSFCHYDNDKLEPRLINLDDYESFSYFQKRLKNDGVIEKLVQKGLVDGDTIRVGAFEFTYFE